MLRPAQIDVIEATAPVLAEHGETITRHFYSELLTANPEVRPMFSPAHQRSGVQPRALADAVIAFATHVRDLDALGPAVERIGNKHVALGVKPEHYPIVGEQLLKSIGAVLGDGATDAVIDAWGAAYGLLTQVLTGREGELYDAQRERHGWSGFRTLAVTSKVVESDCITSFVLRDPNGGTLPAAEPGQYVTLRLPTSDGSTTLRTYSLSSWNDSGEYRISVKREPAPSTDVDPGYGSAYLHDHVEVDDMLDVAPPIGEFVLEADSPDASPLVFIAGGVGVTPLLAMMQCAAERHHDRSVVFVQAARTKAALAFEDELRAAAAAHGDARVHVRLSEDEGAACDSHGFVDRALLDSLWPDGDPTVYLCGPAPFMQMVEATLLDMGVPADRIRTEAFGPLASTNPAPAAATGS